VGFRFPELRARHRRFPLGRTLGFLANAAVATATSLGYFSGYQGDALNAGWQAPGPPLKMGIGIHAGTVFAGNVGSSKRKKHTLAGDAVNVAVRVEGLNKELHTTLLITGDTYVLVKDQVKVKDCDEVKVKGRHQAVKVYEVLALAEDGEGRPRRRPWVRDGGSFWGPWLFWRGPVASPPRPETPSPF
jgi:class 3 adenylate cyclase